MNNTMAVPDSDRVTTQVSQFAASQDQAEWNHKDTKDAEGASTGAFSGAGAVAGMGATTRAGSGLRTGGAAGKTNGRSLSTRPRVDSYQSSSSSTSHSSTAGDSA